MEKTNSWTKLNHADAMSFCDKYIDYLNASKTERLAVKSAETLAPEAGFKPFEKFTELNPGDKVYFKNRGKNFSSFLK